MCVFTLAWYQHAKSVEMYLPNPRCTVDMELEKFGPLQYVSVELYHPQCGPANALMVAKISICPPSVGEISNSVVILLKKAGRNDDRNS
jgi:hypothetical protein